MKRFRFMASLFCFRQSVGQMVEDYVEAKEYYGKLLADMDKEIVETKSGGEKSAFYDA